jgi:phosphate starvation-inducible protein PhoH and related proteins
LSKRLTRRQKALADDLLAVSTGADVAPKFSRKVGTLVPANEKQKEAMMALDAGVQVVFLTGSAGVGKSLIAANYAAKRLANGTAKKIYLLRPAVAVGKSIGLLPGEIDEKLAPYFAQTRLHLESFLGVGYVKYAFDKKTIEMFPVEYTRGRSFEHCIVIAEESQNFTAEEMEMMLTRIGEGCTMIFTGDTKQHDLKGKSGLRDCLDLVQKMTREHPSYLTREDVDNLADNIHVAEFGPNDVIRSGLARAVVRMYYYND